MNEATETLNDDLPRPDQLTVLHERAAQLGLKVSPKIGLEKLRERVNAAMNGEAEISDDGDDDDDGDTKGYAAPKPMSTAERRAKMRREELRLIRVRITCLNPKKKDLRGEVFTVANKYIGEVKKFIPYGEVTDEGYHVPNILLKQLKTRKFQYVKTRQNRQTGNIDVERRDVAEFAIEELPPLTKEELKELAAAQAAAGGVS